MGRKILAAASLKILVWTIAPPRATTTHLPIHFPRGLKITGNSSVVKIPVFLGEKSPPRGKERLRAIVSLRGPKHPAHRGGRADQSERTEIVRTYGKEINIVDKQNARFARKKQYSTNQMGCKSMSEFFDNSFHGFEVRTARGLKFRLSQDLPIHFSRRLKITAKQFGSENGLRRERKA